MISLFRPSDIPSGTYFNRGLRDSLLACGFSGPIFILALGNWPHAIGFVALCAISYFTVRKLAAPAFDSSVGRSEVYWLGFVFGFVFALVFFFALIWLK